MPWGWHSETQIPCLSRCPEDGTPKTKYVGIWYLSRRVFYDLYFIVFYRVLSSVDTTNLRSCFVVYSYVVYRTLFSPDFKFADEMFLKQKMWPKQHKRIVPCSWNFTFRFRHDFSLGTFYTLWKSCTSMERRYCNSSCTNNLRLYKSWSFSGDRIQWNFLGADSRAKMRRISYVSGNNTSPSSGRSGGLVESKIDLVPETSVNYILTRMSDRENVTGSSIMLRKFM